MTAWSGPGQSRLWGGVHFQPAIDVSRRPMGRQIGDLAYEFVQAHIDGTAE